MRLSLLAACALMGLTLCATVAARASSTPVCAGDCNGDTAVGITELMRTVVAAGLENPNSECARADGDGDGVVSSGELRRAVDHLFDRCGHGPLWVDRPDLCFPVVGDTPPASQQIVLHAQMPWTAQSMASWLNVTPESGPAGDSDITVSVDAGAAGAGFVGSVRFRDSANIRAEVALGLTAFQPSVSPGWLVQEVVTVGAPQETTALALDPAGRPAISYLRGATASNTELWYAFRYACQWTAEEVEKQAQASSLVFDSTGRPHIAFNSNQHLALRYGTRQFSGWQIATVDQSLTGTTGFRPSLQVDADDRPHVSFQIKSGLFDLKYAEYDGSAWHVETIDEVDHTGWDSSLALDASGAPRISYHTDPSLLRFASRDAGVWTVGTVTGGGGKPSSLAIDASGVPLIARHAINPSGTLQLLARESSGEWRGEVIDQQGGQRLRAGVALALDSTQAPHVAYVDLDDKALKFASRQMDGSWLVKTIDQHAPNDIGDYCSLQIDAQDVAHISYLDLSSGVLKYAHGPAR